MRSGGSNDRSPSGWNDPAEHCVKQLFGGPLEAWRIAGLPDPGEEARAYMANMEPPGTEPASG